MEFDYNDLIERINEADYVLVGIGEEFLVKDEEDNLIYAYNNLANILNGKNYYIVTLCNDGIIYESELDKEKITYPFDESEENKSWDNYLKWLSCTLNRNLLIVELGALLSSPEVIRWPFEKTVMLNNKASMIRINGILPNIPAEISGKAISIKENAYKFMQFEE